MTMLGLNQFKLHLSKSKSRCYDMFTLMIDEFMKNAIQMLSLHW